MEYSFSTSFGNLSSKLVLDIRKVFVSFLSQAQLEITTDEWFVLSKLFHTKASTQNEIANELGLSKVKITRLIAVLENKNFISRETGMGDKRFKNVTLTEEGKAMYRIVEPIAKETLKKIFDGFSEAEKQLQIEFYNRMLSNLRQT
ncbi:MAG: hypothetical protein AUK44_01025 [Porphyromonadaceae bacterium CG2_30_38_12]|nr:MAG: hypothetical protein AUK44_01025 [Porphyromonadaceae bacterium CG2_30_38_12]